MTRISIVVAMDEGGLIGAGNGLPWRLPNDLKHFKRTTIGKPVLMGRKTWESIGKPLPERQNLVMSRHPDFHPEGAKVVRTLDGALRLAEADGYAELMVIGGAQVYALALSHADTLYLTRIHARLQGDAWFPLLDWSEWIRESSQPQLPDDRNAHAHSFEVWRRLPSAA